MRYRERQNRRKRGAALLLALLLLIGCGGCQKTGARADPKEEPANVHEIQAKDKTYYVLDREYTGDCAVQKVQFYSEVPDWKPDDYCVIPVENDEAIPEGFSQQTVMSLQEYTDYCERWGLEPAYTDPEKAYAVLAGGEACMDVVLLQLADVWTQDDTVTIFLRDRFHNPNPHSCGFVVTVPVEPSIRQLQLIPVYDAEEAKNLQRYGTPYDPNETAAPEKPVLYLYPETETEVSVLLDYDGELTCTYPAYRDGWSVTAQPDGTLTDKDGMVYSYLYWEGRGQADYDFSEGFCVRGADTAAFLEKALASLGLNRREANEFIVYWLPRLEQNPWNLITFQTEAYTDTARLVIEPKPDTVIRIFMAWKPLQSAVEIPPQTLTTPDRIGFTVVEWGGAELIN